MGANTKAIECGEVTSLAVSADFSYIASGYSTGHIFTWDLAKPSYPNIHIRPLAKSALAKSKHSDGHVENTSVIYLNFVGKRHSALISGDVIGMAFSHDTKDLLLEEPFILIVFWADTRKQTQIRRNQN